MGRLKGEVLSLTGEDYDQERAYHRHQHTRPIQQPRMIVVVHAKRRLGEWVMHCRCGCSARRRVDAHFSDRALCYLGGYFW